MSDSYKVEEGGGDIYLDHEGELVVKTWGAFDMQPEPQINRFKLYYETANFKIEGSGEWASSCRVFSKLNGEWHPIGEVQRAQITVDTTAGIDIPVLQLTLLPVEEIQDAQG